MNAVWQLILESDFLVKAAVGFDLILANFLCFEVHNALPNLYSLHPVVILIRK